ncbi:MAG: lysoplasmalogenase [Bacteroidota bacterium]
MFTFDHLLTSVFVVVASVYLAAIHRLPFAGDFVLKSIPVLCLAILAGLYIPGTTGKLLAVGFIFSVGGDISLSFTHKSEQFFLLGLGSFLIAHVIYVIAFSRDFQFSAGKLPLMGLWLVFAVAMLVALFPRLGAMRIPVLAYIAVILSMVIAATGWRGPHPGMLLAGAVLFMLSDSMIAVNKFLTPISWSKYFIMVTYYVGQLLICRAFLPPSTGA